MIQEIARGAIEGGADVPILTIEGIMDCKGCNDGWGVCRNEHVCTYGKDGFTEAHQQIRQADALCLVMPADPDAAGASMTGLLERLRRCEFGPYGALANKPILIVSFPDGADNSLLSCLEQTDRFCRQTGAVIFDYLGVNSWNSDYSRISAYYAGRAIAYGRKAGDNAPRSRQ
ncbi:MAG: NAD(P)H-dependent oxidoreductase [Clostridiales bacterium]|nr:NAD(P)H-dependent oxidoreductase [Clostridiales bacterium]